MKNNNKKSSLYSGILGLTFGILFATVGIAVLVKSIKDIISNDSSEIVTQIILSVLFLGFGIFLIILGGKKIYLRIRQNKTYGRGIEATAEITDYKSVSYSKGKNTRIRYAFILLYSDGVSDKTFTTDYLFDVNEFNYLKKLEKVKIKFDGDFATICEPFPKDIYKIDSDYGIELEFYSQKSVKILFCLWVLFFIAALGFLVASFFMGNSTLTLAAILTVFAVQFPFAITLAIYLIKWYNRKK